MRRREFTSVMENEQEGEWEEIPPPPSSSSPLQFKHPLHSQKQIDEL